MTLIRLVHQFEMDTAYLVENLHMGWMPLKRMVLRMVIVTGEMSMMMTS